MVAMPTYPRAIEQGSCRAATKLFEVFLVHRVQRKRPFRRSQRMGADGPQPATRGARAVPRLSAYYGRTYFFDEVIP
jgi:hypothetical protein